MNFQTKICQNCQKEFAIEPEDFAFYEKIKVPAPTFCPECRMIRKMMFRNERSLYKRKCDATGKEIISIYSPDKPFKVYEQKYWWSDNWNPIEYGRDYDFNKPFFEQLKQLYNAVPKCTLYDSHSVRSEYCNICINLKDCYLVFGSGFAENSLYSNTLVECKDIIEGSWLEKCENSGYLIDCGRCYQTFFTQECQDCINSLFIYDCRNCQNCLFSSNLRNKSYYIRNRQASKEEFERLRTMVMGSNKALQRAILEFNKIKTSALHRFMSGKNCFNSSGNFIYNAKNAINSYFVTEGEDIRNGIKVIKQKDSADVFGVSWGDLMCESMNADFCSFSKFIINADHVSISLYSIDVQSVENCFGCIGLRHKQYCILNKQYTKEEYEKLVPKIIDHINKMPYIDKKGRVYKYGEFFPPELSPFAYNETIAQEYFPLTKEQVIEQGYSWKEPEERNIQFSIPNSQLPDNIKDVSDDIIDKVIECANAPAKISKGNLSGQVSQCTTAFKIIPQELQFYRRMNLPLPRLCPNCRHYQRLKQRNPLKLWHRKCMCGGQTSANGVYKNTIKHFHGTKPCPNEFETTYSPERKEIVYCEKCYLSEVV